MPSKALTVQNYLMTVFSNKVVIVPIKWKSVLVSTYGNDFVSVIRNLKFFRQAKMHLFTSLIAEYFIDCRQLHVQSLQ